MAVILGTAQHDAFLRGARFNQPTAHGARRAGLSPLGAARGVSQSDYPHPSAPENSLQGRRKRIGLPSASLKNQWFNRLISGEPQCPWREFLRQLNELMPVWLEQFNPGEAFTEQFCVPHPLLSWRGHRRTAREALGSTRSAHCFVYADYGVDRAAVEAELEHPEHRFWGYHTLVRVHLTEHNLSPRGSDSAHQYGRGGPGEVSLCCRSCLRIP